MQWDTIENLLLEEMLKEINQIPIAPLVLDRIAVETIQLVLLARVRDLMGMRVNVFSVDGVEIADDDGHLWSYDTETHRFMVRQPRASQKRYVDNPLSFKPATRYGPGNMNE